jgi:hypothetical protein
MHFRCVSMFSPIGMALLLSVLLMYSGSSAQSRGELIASSKTTAGQLFIFQGAYDSLGAVDEIARLAARHQYIVLTHGFYLDGSGWRNGKCLDVNYTRMPELLAKTRFYNPAVKIFGYVSDTADHTGGCWPQPSVLMPRCPDGACGDFRAWTDLWLNLESAYSGVAIDGIFVDLVHPALIGAAVRDSVFSYVKSRDKLIMANALSDTIGLKFAASSPFLKPEDFVLIEGYSLLAGSPNLQTAAMNAIVLKLTPHWAALVTEYYGSPLICNSDNMTNAYDMFLRNGGTAFAYQSADLGTQSGTWVYCRNSVDPSAVGLTGAGTVFPQSFLEQVYPNPFNPATTVSYYVAEPAFVKVKVCNLLGQTVQILVNEYQSIGSRRVLFEANNLPSGQYICTFEAGGKKQSHIMTHLK